MTKKMTREEKIIVIADYLRECEDSLSDGYRFYCANSYDWDHASEAVMEHLRSIAKGILEKIEE